MRNMPLKLVGCLVVFVAGTGPAAADNNYHPGVACLASGSDNNSIERQAGTGRAFNMVGATRRFICPAIRESGTRVRALVWVIDRHPALTPAGRVTCWLQSRPPTGPAMDVSSASTPVNHNSPIPFALTLAAIDTQAPAGFYLIYCDVPGVSPFGRSGLVTYQTFEA